MQCKGVRERRKREARLAIATNKSVNKRKTEYDTYLASRLYIIDFKILCLSPFLCLL